MALPVPNVNPVLADMPNSGMGGDVFRQPERVGIGSGLEALSQGMDALAQTAAKKAGENDASAALQRNADGSLTPIAGQENHFIMGNAGIAYQHAFETGTLAALQTNINEQAQSTRNQFQNDPDGFKIAWGKYADGLRQNYSGPLGQAAFGHAIQVGSQTGIGLIEDKRKNDLQSFGTNTETAINGLRNDIMSTARSTQSDSPAFIEKSQQYRQLQANYEALSANPELASKWTKEKVASELSLFKQEATNEWAIGNVKRVRDQTKSIDKAVEWADKNIRGPHSAIPPEKQDAYYHAAVAQVQQLTQEQQATLQASKATTHAFLGLFHNGTPPAANQVEGAITAARNAFDVEGAAQISAAHEAYQRSIRPVQGLSPVAGAGAIMGAGGGGYVNKVIAKESVGNPNAQGHGSSAGGLAQFTEGTWNGLAKNHPELFLTPGRGRFDPEQTKRALGVFTAENQTQLAQAGIPTNERNTYMAHFLGAGGAVDFIKAMQADPSRSAASVNPKAAAANRSIFYDGDRPRSLQEVYALQTKGFGEGGTEVAGRASPIPFSPDELARNPWLASAAAGQFTADKGRSIQFARDQMQTIGQAVSMGIAPPQSRVAEVLQLAKQYPDELGEAATKMQAHVTASPIAAGAAGLPDGGAGLIAGAREEAATSPDLYHLTYAQSLQQQIEGRAQRLAADPHGYAAEVGWTKGRPVPFEAMANPQAVGASSPVEAMTAALTSRREASFQIGSRLGLPPEKLMFTPKDVKSIGSLLQGASGQGAAMILQGLDGQLRPEEMQALAGNKDFVNAVGGLARSGDPAKVGAAFGFMDKQYRTNPLAFSKEYGKDMADKMVAWNGKLAFMGPEQAAKELQKAGDPIYQKQTHELRTLADKDTKDLTPALVVDKAFDTAFSMQPGNPVSDTAASSSMAMLQDYRDNYRGLFAESGDKTLAENEAVKRLQMKWGPSDINGGRVMAYPPERHYPPDIYGRKDYIKAQLSNDIGEIASKVYQAQGVDAEKLRSAEHALVADDRTQEDLANRQFPSYRVIVKDDAGRWVPLMADHSTPFRFRADTSVIGAQQDKFLTERRQSQTTFMSGAM